MYSRKLKISLMIIGLMILYPIITMTVEKQQENRSNSMTVGVLQYISHPSLDEIYQGILTGLKEQGLEEGKNLKVVFQNGQGDQSKLNMMSQQLISEKPDVLIGIATPAAQALANATQEIPIVLGAITDPENAGLVSSNEHPGGNITGVSDQSPVEAQFDLLKLLLPATQRVGILISSAEDNAIVQAERAEAAAKERGLTTRRYVVPSSNEINSIVSNMVREIDTLYIPTDNTIANNMSAVAQIATQAHVPIIPSVASMVEEGGVATIGINQTDLGVQTGRMAADIVLKNQKPGDVPIYVFSEGDLIVNEEQLDSLGITVPKEVEMMMK
ncbi:tryptophan ABC transporter substrate-binding protein [Vagococcus lutrae]|uniref:tryptophan ABC transporter substrate-binding protein n=1 Tax=Vagococcus lutrae TaxID=81947 RepID=UPI0023306BB6|nr:tryptophan ABC transporter substrate-binding protein [Vagococcus lutrae]MDT2812442.1 tryptophan ABC transporter substrate-binding protein [Vagococcus lutrae]MDT2819155.1 tryptophan ABC transporter substrate-binding protein [Vagococcus lutrae]MDT2844110.1 tryptophan ABC transporter substrate-binding protein [Vagococcus lutrae]WCG05061.1 tryptophan ABC transporter substrate-binding protein [Vagococcus lutrae]